VSLVLDPSLALNWYFEDESTAATDALLDRVAEEGAIVPSLWRLEIANALQVAIRRKRVDRGFRDETIAQLSRLPITVDSETNAHAWGASLALADRFGITLYDATYLELAQRRNVPLATSDRALRRAARQFGVQLATGYP